MQTLQRQGAEPALPDPGPAAYLASYLWEIGPVLPTGMGAAPITHSELASWQSNTGCELNAWEAQTLRELSKAWLNQQHESQDPTAPAPWVDVEPETRSSRLDAQARSIFKVPTKAQQEH
jgi:hypothetical protein